MAKIIINATTHRDSCLHTGDSADAAAYDDAIAAFLITLARAAQSRGLGFDVDPRGIGLASYRVVDETDITDYEAAHEFMQSPAAEFWAQI